MPKPAPRESKKHYLARCIRDIANEGGHTHEQAIGKCYGMWKYYKRKRTK